MPTERAALLSAGANHVCGEKLELSDVLSCRGREMYKKNRVSQPEGDSRNPGNVQNQYFSRSTWDNPVQAVQNLNRKQKIKEQQINSKTNYPVT
jgi:nuclear transport factor 2 (NTF2) superfamily protein